MVFVTVVPMLAPIVIGIVRRTSSTAKVQTQVADVTIVTVVLRHKY